jgi:hypothetical protein
MDVLCGEFRNRMFTPCCWPAFSSYILYLGYAVWYEATGQGLVYKPWLYTAATGCRILGATLVRCQWFTAMH